jgi:regulator of RNase E activity RraA
MPGDIVVGDRDGVVVVPRDHAEDVLSLVGALVQREAKRVAEIRSGGLFRAEIDESLRRNGVIE